VQCGNKVNCHLVKKKKKKKKSKKSKNGRFSLVIDVRPPSAGVRADVVVVVVANAFGVRYIYIYIYEDSFVSHFQTHA
jgi:hypothetical protein